MLNDRADVDFALHHGCSTRYKYRDMVVEPLDCSLPEEPSLPPTFSSIRSELRQLAWDTLCFTKKLEHASRSSPIDAYAFQSNLTALCQRLLEFNPIGRPLSGHALEDVCHLGLVSCMITFLLQFTGRRLVNYNLISMRFQGAIRAAKYLLREDDGLLLWLLCVYGDLVLAPSWPAGPCLVLCLVLGSLIL